MRRISYGRIVTGLLCAGSLTFGAATVAHAGESRNVPAPAQQDDGAPPLMRGDRNELVSWWQERLNVWLQLSGSATYPIVVDGWYGPNTEAATLEFQRANATVDEDGIVDPVDRVALHDAIEELRSDEGAPPLVRGDRGQLVSWWQERLNEWLQLSGSATYPIVLDGWYGPNTEAATLEFQRANATVEPDGIVDPVDRVALHDAIAELRAGEGAAPLALGDRGQLVTWWQDRLNDWLRLSGSESYPIVVDGWYGPNTEAATLEFQRANGTVDEDGIVNPVDRVALEEAINAMERPDTTPATPVGSFDTGAESVTAESPAEPALLTQINRESFPDFDRIVFEFAQGGPDVSYEVRYVSEPPANPAGEAVNVGGEAMLQVDVRPASIADLSGEEATETYTGPERFSADALSTVEEVALVESFEANMVWLVGTASELPFAVALQENPLRMVIDVAKPTTLLFPFGPGTPEWTAAISDYSEATAPEDFVAEPDAGPPPGLEGDGFFHLAASNPSADLFMYLRNQVDDAGLEPDQTYRTRYEVRFASDAPTGCAGIGGSPGESVWMKVGASAEEPVPTGTDPVSLTVDKGAQSNGGAAASVAGVIANGIACEEAQADDDPDFAYVLLSGELDGVTTGPDGELWLFVGTDAGFEGFTSIYYDHLVVELIPTGA